MSDHLIADQRHAAHYAAAARMQLQLGPNPRQAPWRHLARATELQDAARTQGRASRRALGHEVWHADWDTYTPAVAA